VTGSPDRAQLLALAVRCMNAGVSFVDVNIPATKEPRPLTPEGIEALAAKYVDELLPPDPHPAHLGARLCEALGLDAGKVASLTIRSAPSDLVRVDVEQYVLKGGLLLQELRRYELKELPTEQAEEPWERDNDATRDLLGLHGYDVPPAFIESWTDEQVRAVDEWAAAEHLRASDNDDVQVPPRPSCIDEWLRQTGQQ
jgi:hypothetical protein